MIRSILLIFLIAACSSLELQVPSSIQPMISDGTIEILLETTGSIGQVTYNVEGLPPGLSLEGNIIKGQLAQNFGNFPIEITASDQQGNKDSKITVIRSSQELSEEAKQIIQGQDEIQITESQSSDSQGGFVATTTLPAVLTPQTSLTQSDLQEEQKIISEQENRRNLVNQKPSENVQRILGELGIPSDLNSAASSSSISSSSSSSTSSSVQTSSSSQNAMSSSSTPTNINLPKAEIPPINVPRTNLERSTTSQSASVSQINLPSNNLPETNIQSSTSSNTASTNSQNFATENLFSLDLFRPTSENFPLGGQSGENSQRGAQSSASPTVTSENLFQTNIPRPTSLNFPLINQPAGSSSGVNIPLVSPTTSSPSNIPAANTQTVSRPQQRSFQPGMNRGVQQPVNINSPPSQSIAAVLNQLSPDLANSFRSPNNVSPDLSIEAFISNPQPSGSSSPDLIPTTTSSRSSTTTVSIQNSSPIIRPTTRPTPRPTPAPAPAPNFIPQVIRTSQAPRTNLNRKQITQSQIQSASIFQNQLNKNKAIANLLDIIDQLRSNINAAQSDVGILQRQYDTAVTQQRSIQDKVKSAENKSQRLQEAINKLLEQQSILRSQLQELEGIFNNVGDTLNNREIITNQLNKAITNFEDQVFHLKKNIQNQKKQRELRDNQIVETMNMIQDLKYELEKKQKELVNIDGLIDSNTRVIRNIDDEIQDLKDRMNAAIERKTIAEREDKRLRNLKEFSPIICKQLEDEIRLKTRDFDALKRNREDIEEQIAESERMFKDKSNKLAELRIQLDKIRTQIQVNNDNQQAYNIAIAAKKQEIQQSQATLNFLNNQKPGYDQDVQAAFRELQQITILVNRAQQNLQAIINRWQSDQRRLEFVVANLQKARAEKEEADLAMERLLSERSEVLPYALPNSNEFITTNTGSIVTSTNINNQNINSFFSSPGNSNGNGIGQYRVSLYRPNNQNINGMSPFMTPSGQILGNFYQTQAGSLLFNGNFDCSLASNINNLSSLSGQITSIGLNTITIAANNNEYIGALSPCSSIYSQQPNYIPRVGDHIQFSGQNQGNGIYYVYNGVCSR